MSVPASISTPDTEWRAPIRVSAGATAPPDVDEPYVGPEPYRRDQAGFFFGRERESDDLEALVLAEREVLLYAPSGAGKTSLLNAGLIPRLDKRGARVLPPGRFACLPPLSDEARRVRNVYVYSLLRNWETKGADEPSERFARTTLSEYLRLKWPASAPPAPEGEAGKEEEPDLAPRVVIVDQLEEMFTLYRARWQDRAGFFEQVHDAMSGSPVLLRPSDVTDYDALARRLQDALLAGSTPGNSSPPELDGCLLARLREQTREQLRQWVHAEGAPESFLRDALLRDLNDVIRHHALYQRRPQEPPVPLPPDLADFARELQNDPAEGSLTRLNRRLLERVFPEAIKPMVSGDPRLRIIFAIREDFLADVDSHAHRLPGDLRTRMRLEHLREPQALDAIRKPVEKIGVRYAPGAAETLVHELMKSERLSPDDTTDAPETMQKAPGVLSRPRGRARRPRRGREEEGSKTERRITGEFVEPLYLQIVCQNIWENVKGATEIAQDHVRQYGSVHRALREFYQSRLRVVLTQSRGISEARLRRWFADRLITPRRTRDIVVGDERETDGCPTAVVKALDREHLLHSERRGDVILYELAHDRLIDAILDSNGAFDTRRHQVRIQVITGLITGTIGGVLAAAGVLWLTSELARGRAQLRVPPNPAPPPPFVDANLDVQYPRGSRRGPKSGHITVQLDASMLSALSDVQKRAAKVQDVAAILDSPAQLKAPNVAPKLLSLLDVLRNCEQTWEVADTQATHASQDLRSVCAEAERLLESALDRFPEFRPAPKLVRKLFAYEPIRSVTVWSDEEAPADPLLASAGGRGSATIWDISTGDSVTGIQHPGAVRAITFDSQGRRVATAGEDGTVRVWEAKKGGKILLTLRAVAGRGGRRGAAPCVAFSPDGKLLASGGGGGSYRLTDLSTGKTNAVAIGPVAAPTAIDFSPDGRRLATAYARDAIISSTKQNRRSGRQSVPPMRLRHRANVIYVAFTPDGQHLATASGLGPRIWDIKTGQYNSYLNTEKDRANESKFVACRFMPDTQSSPNSGFWTTVTDRGEARLWDSDTARAIGGLAGSTGRHAAFRATCVDFSQDGRYLAVGTEEGVAYVYQWRSEDLLDQIREKLRKYSGSKQSMSSH